MCLASGTLDKIKAGNKAPGIQSSGGIGFGMPATTKTQSSRMQRTASSANFMALFGPTGAA